MSQKQSSNDKPMGRYSNHPQANSSTSSGSDSESKIDDTGIGRTIASLPGAIANALLNISEQAADGSGESAQKAQENLANITNAVGFILQGLNIANFFKQVRNIIEQFRLLIRDAANIMLGPVLKTTETALNPRETPEKQLAANMALIGFYVLVAGTIIGLPLALAMAPLHTAILFVLFVELTFSGLGGTAARIQRWASSTILDR